MNANKQVFQFTAYAILILLALSISTDYVQALFPRIGNINLLADITQKPNTAATASSNQETGQEPAATKENEPREAFNDFDAYRTPGRIVNFSSDSTMPALPELMQKLMAIRQGQKRKVRIAWLGDSMIEGDMITQNLRKSLQEFFSGNNGVGFVPVKAVTEDLRATAKVKHSDSWEEGNFKTNETEFPLFLSGHVFQTSQGDIQLTDATVTDSGQVVEKYLLCGPIQDQYTLQVNKQPKQLIASEPFNKILLDKSSRKDVALHFEGKPFPVYGISSEPETGVVLDNFSFRGITGVELKQLDEHLLESLASSGHYDLIVLQYGVNLMFRPNDKDYKYYYKMMGPVLKKLKQHLPNTEMLMVSCSDRAFRYDNEWKTAIGLDSLLATQARLAYEQKIPFLNLYQTMGGAGTIVRWADTTPSLANKDYIHPNIRGAKVISDLLFATLIRDYKKVETPSAARITIQ